MTDCGHQPEEEEKRVRMPDPGRGPVTRRWVPVEWLTDSGIGPSEDREASE